MEIIDSLKEPESDLDIEENKTDIFTKLYSVIAFAYYII